MSSFDDMPLPSPPGTNNDESRQGQILGWAITMMILSFVAVLLRLVSRWLVRNKLHMDDWLAISSLPFAWIMCLIAIYGVVHDNYGLHMGRTTFGKLREYLIGLWVFDMNYSFAISLSKLSIVALWWRIFEVKSCHIVLGILTVMQVAWLIGTVLTTIFSCFPVQGFWNLTIPAKCITQSNFWLGSAIPNIVIDVALLIIPNFYIAKLSISKSQKLGLSFIFALGTFVVICSCLRLWQLIEYNAEVKTDLTWATTTTGVWSFVEASLSVVCCCLPSMRPILRLIIHGRLGTSPQPSDNATVGNRSSRYSLRSPVFPRHSHRAVQPVPMQRLSVGVNKKTEWWEGTTNVSINGDDGDSLNWPLSAPPRPITPRVNTTIYAGDTPPPQDDSQRIRSKSAGWPGWRDTIQRQSTAPAKNTWLQLGDSRNGSLTDSSGVSVDEKNLDKSRGRGRTLSGGVSALSESEHGEV